GRVDGLTFAFGTGVAGVAGCILGGMYGNVVPNMGQDFIVEAFMVVILGGMGQLKGVVAGGLMIGVTGGLAEQVSADAIIPALFQRGSTPSHNKIGWICLPNSWPWPSLP